MQIAFESPDAPEIRQLIAALDAYQRALYPPESVHLLDIAALLRPEVRFAVAREAPGAPALGCGAVVLRADHGEIKRMYVHPSQRGRGLGALLMDALEAEAFARGCRLLRLETGPLQPAALALYARHGYRMRGPFSDYRPDPLSVFMEKSLPAARG